MNIKEIGTCGFFVIGGAVYGVTQLGLNDALSEDLRPFAEVSHEERPAYMDQVTAEFGEAFDSYVVQTETYVYAGLSEFTTAPGSGTFLEVVRQDEPVPQEEIQGLRDFMNAADFCGQDEMTMFTENGWTYSFSMRDSNGRDVYSVVCSPAETAPETPQLRGLS